MKKLSLLLLTLLALTVGACTAEPGTKELETAQFEEKQNNLEHATRLYTEIVSKYPGTINAKIAQARLDAIKGEK